MKNKIDKITRIKNLTNSLKARLIKKWEKETEQNWPLYEKPLCSKSGRVLRMAGDAYDAHHIIPMEVGGAHEWWNFYPLSYGKIRQDEIQGEGSVLNQMLMDNED